MRPQNLPRYRATHSCCEHVTRQFGALRAIDDISFEVGAGERRAILGANGAGKTTLFNAITGDFPPTLAACIFLAKT